MHSTGGGARSGVGVVHRVADERSAGVVGDPGLDAGDVLAAAEREPVERLTVFYVAVGWRTRHHCRPTPPKVDADRLARASGSLVDTGDCLDLLVADADQCTALAAMLASTDHPARRHLPWLVLGLITYFVGRADTSGWPEMLLLALGSADESGLDPAVAGHLREDLALALSGRGEHHAALEEARRATALFGLAADERSRASALGTEAIILGRLDRIPEAIALREQARLVSESVGDDRAVAAAHRDLGLLLARAGDLPAAIVHEGRSLELYTRIGVTRGVAMAAVNLGVMLRDTGDLARARAHLEQSVAIFHGIGDRAGETEALDELGYWHVVAGDPGLGLTILNDGLALVDDSDTGQWEASIRKRLGLALLRLGRRAEAEHHWRAAVQIHMRRGEWRAVAEAHQLFSPPAALTSS